LPPRETPQFIIGLLDAAAVCEVWNGITTENAKGHTVNLYNGSRP
jgi:hypothetical protein